MFPKIQEKINAMELIKNKPILSLKPFLHVNFTEETKQEIYVCKKEKELKEIFDGM